MSRGDDPQRSWADRQLDGAGAEIDRVRDDRRATAGAQADPARSVADEIAWVPPAAQRRKGGNRVEPPARRDSHDVDQAVGRVGVGRDREAGPVEGKVGQEQLAETSELGVAVELECDRHRMERTDCGEPGSYRGAEVGGVDCAVAGAGERVEADADALDGEHAPAGGGRLDQIE